MQPVPPGKLCKDFPAAPKSHQGQPHLPVTPDAMCAKAVESGSGWLWKLLGAGAAGGVCVCLYRASPAEQ